MTVREAAHTLYEHLGMPRYPHWVQCVAFAEKSEYSDIERIIVMLVREPMPHEGTVPDTWYGYPVETKVVGEVRFCGTTY